MVAMMLLPIIERLHPFFTAWLFWNTYHFFLLLQAQSQPMASFGGIYFTSSTVLHIWNGSQPVESSCDSLHVTVNKF